MGVFPTSVQLEPRGGARAKSNKHIPSYGCSCGINSTMLILILPKKDSFRIRGAHPTDNTSPCLATGGAGLSKSHEVP